MWVQLGHIFFACLRSVWEGGREGGRAAIDLCARVNNDERDFPPPLAHWPLAPLKDIGARFIGSVRRGDAIMTCG